MQQTSSQSDARTKLLESLEPAAPFIQLCNEHLLASIARFEPCLHESLHHALSSSGKRLRPVLSFFSGWDTLNAKQDDLIRVSSILEMVHIATLVHDDILDEADMRHQQPSVAAKYGLQQAVLLGDALFAHALELAAEFPTPQICRIVAHATRQLCSGEIIQDLESNQAATNPYALYIRIIELKTAALFEAACELGVLVANNYNAEHPDLAHLRAFGKNLGIAYQIWDDLNDLCSCEQSAGKTLRTDLLTGKKTLPILLLEAKFPQTDLQNLDDFALQAALEEHDIHLQTQEQLSNFLDLAADALSRSSSDNTRHHLGQLLDAFRQLSMAG